MGALSSTLANFWVGGSGVYPEGRLVGDVVEDAVEDHGGKLQTDR